MTEEKNDQQCCGGDDNQQGCCSSSGSGKGFNWQKFIFIVVVIAACAVGAHSFLVNGSGTCPITGKCGADSAAVCPSGNVGEASGCCPSGKPVEPAACCPSEKPAEPAACCPSEKGAEASKGVCPVSGNAEEQK